MVMGWEGRPGLCRNKRAQASASWLSRGLLSAPEQASGCPKPQAAPSLRLLQASGCPKPQAAPSLRLLQASGCSKPQAAPSLRGGAGRPYLWARSMLSTEWQAREGGLRLVGVDVTQYLADLAGRRTLAAQQVADVVRRPHRRLLQRVSLRRWRAAARAAGLDEGAKDLVRVRA
eukprot:scaffold106741_cov48-Phaeocystis_antarctica.AAC.2